MKKQSEPFELHYDGEALQDGAILADDLAPALMGLSDLVEQTNLYLNQGTTSVRLRIRSGAKKGSFIIGLELAGLYKDFVSTFTGSDITALANILSILGISGFGLFQLIKKGKGKKPKKVVEIKESTKIRVEFEDAEPVEVEQTALKLFQDLRARNAASKIVKPLTKEGINTVKFSCRGKETVRINKDEIGYYRLPDEHEGEVISETDSILRIVMVSFQEGNKWRFSDGSSTYYVSILDKDFLDRVHRREVLFGDNDCLHVKLRTKQWYEGDELKISREILKVLKHMSSGTQGLLSFPEQEEGE